MTYKMLSLKNSFLPPESAFSIFSSRSLVILFTNFNIIWNCIALCCSFPFWSPRYDHDWNIVLHLAVAAPAVVDAGNLNTPHSMKIDVDQTFQQLVEIALSFHKMHYHNGHFHNQHHVEGIHRMMFVVVQLDNPCAQSKSS